MALNKANISWSTKQLAKMFDNGSAKNINIKRRNDEIQKRWDVFFTADN